MKTLLILALALLATPAQAADACGGIALGNGSITVGTPLPATAGLSAGTRACLTDLGQMLAARRAVRTVTVAVRLPDAERLEGNGITIAEAYTEVLAAAGVPRSRLSAVAPAAGPGEKGSVTIGFTERRAAQPVALAESVDGPVTAGPDARSMAALTGGTALPAATWIETKVGGRAAVGLADGSRIRIDERSKVLIGAVHLNDDLKRVVEIEVAAGHIETHAAPGGDGSSFDVRTRTGVAGVRGTEFRVRSSNEGMELETVGGLVALGPEGGDTVDVPKGMRSSIGADGVPATPTRMLTEPGDLAPVKGSIARDVELTWGKVSGANNYVVDIARDADFTLGARSIQAWRANLPLPADLEAGKWFWRVVPQDRKGHAGMPSRTYAFTVER